MVYEIAGLQSVGDFYLRRIWKVHYLCPVTLQSFILSPDVQHCTKVEFN